MSHFCTNCGARLYAEVKFCASCGRERAVRTQGEAPPERIQPAPREINAQGQWTQYGQPSSQPAQLRPRRATSPVIAAISGVMALICLCVFVVLPLIKHMKSPTVEAATAIVSAENPIAEVMGVRVDANALNLQDGERTLSVIKSVATEDLEEGFAYVEYDISLGDSHRFLAPVTITLPYDAALIGEGWAGITHYDAHYGLWMPLNTSIDQGAGTATASLTSLSPVRMAYYSKAMDSPFSLYVLADSGHSDARLEVSHNYWQAIQSVPLVSAEEIAGEFLQNGNTNGSARAFLDPGAIGEANTIYTLFGTAADLILSPALQYRREISAVSGAVEKFSTAIGVIGLAIAGAQLVNDCAAYGLRDGTTAANFVKNIATNSSALLSFFAGVSSVATSFFCAAIVLTNWGLDEAVATAEQVKADTMESIFKTYYNDPSAGGFVDEAAWYRFFSNAYYEAWQSGGSAAESYETAMAALQQEIDRHAERFWTDIYRQGSDSLSFAVAEAGRSNYYTPSPEHKAELTAKYKADLHKRLQGTLSKWIGEFMLDRLQGEIYSALWAEAKPFNEYYQVIVQEIAPADSGDPCKYQGYTIRFVCADDGGITLPATAYPEEWRLTAPEDDDEWAVQMEFTLAGYLQAGLPNAVALFPPGSKTDDLKAAEQIVEFSLKPLSDGPTVIDLSGGGDISGVYDVSGSYESKSANYDFTPFQVRVEQSGTSMKITFLNGTDWVLSGVYDESAKRFTGRDTQPVDTTSLEAAIATSTIWKGGDSIITFDTNASPIRATWKLHLKGAQSEDVVDLAGEANVNLTMTKTAEP